MNRSVQLSRARALLKRARAEPGETKSLNPPPVCVIHALQIAINLTIEQQSSRSCFQLVSAMPAFWVCLGANAVGKHNRAGCRRQYSFIRV